MGLGVLSDDEFDAELEKLNNEEKKAAEIKTIPRGRGEGNTEIPAPIREVIAEAAIEGTPSKVIQAQFGISPASVSAYKHSATSTSSYNSPDSRLSEKNGILKEKISLKAQTRLMSAIKELTRERIASAKPREIAAIASEMSRVVKNLEPSGVGTINTTNQTVYQFYVPRVRKEQEYEIVAVNEE